MGMGLKYKRELTEVIPVGKKAKIFTENLKRHVEHNPTSLYLIGTLHPMFPLNCVHGRMRKLRKTSAHKNYICRAKIVKNKREKR